MAHRLGPPSSRLLIYRLPPPLLATGFPDLDLLIDLKGYFRCYLPGGDSAMPIRYVVMRAA